jgi:hypothetical protein
MLGSPPYSGRLPPPGKPGPTPSSSMQICTIPSTNLKKQLARFIPQRRFFFGKKKIAQHYSTFSQELPPARSSVIHT